MKRKQMDTKVQPDDAGTQPGLHWERQISDNQWQVFPAEQNEALTQAARARKQTENLEDGKVDLCKMLHWDKQSGQESRVRATVCEDNSYYFWHWKGDQKNEWITYPAATCLDLQAARNGNRDAVVDFTVGRTHYKLDTGRMLHINQRTKFEHWMECIVSDEPGVDEDEFQQDTSDSDDGMVVPAKKSQTELDAPASQGQGDGVEIKKKRTAPEVQPDDVGTQLGLYWERQISGNEWQVFPAEQNEVLTQAARARKQTENLEDGKVDLCKMLHWDKQSSQESRVRATVCEDNSHYFWHWKGDQGNEWITYPAATCLDLQAARNGDRDAVVDFTVGRTHYKLDTSRMLHINQRTKSEHWMECIVSDAPGAEEDESQQNISDEDEDEDDESVKTLTVKGKAPVDPECTAKLGKENTFH